MASNYTSNYSLNQWAASDRVLRTEFNADNAKIDAALAGKASASALSSLQSTVNGKASTSALNALQTTVDGLKSSKADKTALDALKNTVTQHTSTLAVKGNCQIYTAVYSGTGTFGKDAPTSLSLPDVPEIVFVAAPDGMQAVFIRGMTMTYSSNGGSGSPLSLTWSGKTVRWFNHMSAVGQLNAANTTYLVVALSQAG